MHTSILLVLGWLAVLWNAPFRPTDAVSAQPNPVPPGGSVALKWYFTGDRVTVSGGRFGAGTVVTGKQALTVRPLRTTRYVFRVWYRARPAGGAKASGDRIALRARYPVVVEVVRPAEAPLKSYHDARGWEVRYPRGWKFDPVPLADPAHNALVYFQQEDDSIERLAVSIVPSAGLDADQLARKAKITLPTHYENIYGPLWTATQHAGVPAVLLAFQGMDLTHPGTQTQSVALVFVRGELGYIVSARAGAAGATSRREWLERLVRSFSPGTAITRAAPPGAQP